MDYPYNQNHIYIVGFAQLPKGTPLYELHKIIACGIIVDNKTECIVDVSFNFLMNLTSDFLRERIIGCSIKDGPNEIIEKITQYFHVPPQKAIIQSVRSAYDRYIELKNSKE